MAEPQTARQKSEGICYLCNATLSKASMTRHLKSCIQKAGAEKPSVGRKAKKAKIFHLTVQGSGMPEYWMHLEIPAGATLEDLDRFLRRTWLECCGHMSAFTIQGTEYMSARVEKWDKGMNIKLYNVLSPGMKFIHEYDFGTTTELALKVVSEREGEISKEPVRLLARNNPPLITCQSCGKPATNVCSQCVYEGEGWLCDECASDHECGEDMLLPVVNSPRTGMCGYTG